jgi:hypothetical protein
MCRPYHPEPPSVSEGRDGHTPDEVRLVVEVAEVRAVAVEHAARVVEETVAEQAVHHRADLLVARRADRTGHHRALDEVGVRVGGPVLEREGRVEQPGLQDEAVADRRERHVVVGRRQDAGRHHLARGRHGREVRRDVEVEDPAQPPRQLDARAADERAALRRLTREGGGVDLHPPARKHHHLAAGRPDE